MNTAYYMKTILSYLLIILMVCSCRAFYNVFPTPNDDPGWMHNLTAFKKSLDSLQMEVDNFVESNTSIQRRYDKGNYDRGKYRNYTTLCNNDTFHFSIVFSGNDTLSRIAVDFFKLNNIAFNTLDYKEQRKTIKNNKAVYDSCQACYRKIFLAPLKERMPK
jgi:hypothetical protein